MLAQLCAQLGLEAEPIMEALPVHMAVSAAVLGAPGVIALALDAAGRLALILNPSWPASWAPQAQTATAGAGGGTGGGGGEGRGSARMGLGLGFVGMAYGYLPLVWAGTLAHYLLLWCEEAGRILPVRDAACLLFPQNPEHSAGARCCLPSFHRKP